MIRKKITFVTLLFATIACHCVAQTLSVPSIEAATGAQTSITVNISNVETDITALQFRLSLPEGIALNETGITKGNALRSHEVVVRSLKDGDRLFVLYDMDKVLVADGTLLTLPVTLPSEAGTLSGSLTAVRTATTSAISQPCADVSFTIKVTKPEQPVTITENDITIKNTVMNGGGEGTNNAIYDLQGHRVANPTKGIYIIGGKKIMK